MNTYTTRRRTTVLASNTLESVSAALDSRSILALEWATHWATAHGGLKPRPAVILRRALMLYAGHLETLEESRSELVAIAQAGKGQGSARECTQGRARLETAEGRHIAWLDVVHSPESRQLTRDIDAALEVHMGVAQ